MEIPAVPDMNASLIVDNRIWMNAYDVSISAIWLKRFVYGYGPRYETNKRNEAAKFSPTENNKPDAMLTTSQHHMFVSRCFRHHL